LFSPVLSCYRFLQLFLRYIVAVWVYIFTFVCNCNLLRLFKKNSHFGGAFPEDKITKHILDALSPLSDSNSTQNTRSFLFKFARLGIYYILLSCFDFGIVRFILRDALCESLTGLYLYVFSKVGVKFSLCLTKHHAIGYVLGSGVNRATHF
jgi:hypothetical protein